MLLITQGNTKTFLKAMANLFYDTTKKTAWVESPGIHLILKEAMETTSTLLPRKLYGFVMKSERDEIDLEFLK